MVTSEPIPTAPEQKAMAALICDHLEASQRRKASQGKPRRRTSR
jgi:hypothetical protein